MKGSELRRLLAKNNIRLVAHGANHDLYCSPITGKTFPVPRHAKEIAKGTLDNILKDAGLNNKSPRTSK